MLVAERAEFLIPGRPQEYARQQNKFGTSAVGVECECDSIQSKQRAIM